MPDTITITDDRTGKTVTVPIEGGVFPAAAVRELDPSLFIYDPAYMQTASCRSDITYLDGGAGILRYRGYPIEQLAEHSTFIEVAYLLLHGELPTAAQLEEWRHDVTHHTFIHENMRKRFVDGFHYDAHPMGIFVSAIAALGTFYDGAKEIHDEGSRRKQILRLIAKTPTIAAMSYRFSQGLPFNYPDNDLSYPANFLNMMWKVGNDYHVDPVLERAMDILFILHADHEQNCGTTAMRVVGSSHADPYSAASAAASALYGPLHGGANEAVVRMLSDIGSIENVPAFIESVKAGEGRLMGFGHRVYKNYDPRDHQEHRLRRVRGDRQEPAARHRVGPRRCGPLRLVLRRPQALPERRLLFGPHLPGDGVPGRDVHRALRHPTHGRLARSLAGAAQRRRPEDLAAASVVHRPRRARVRRHHAALTTADAIGTRARSRSRGGHVRVGADPRVCR